MKIKTPEKLNRLINLFDRYYDSWFAPHKVFLILAVCFGMLFAVLTPPLMVNDEQAHFWKAYNLSEGNLAPTTEKDGVYGEYLPASVVGLFGAYRDFQDQPLEQRDYDINDIRNYFHVPLNAETKTFVGMETTMQYSPIPYIPQALGIYVGKTLGLTPYVIMIFGRVTNLLVVAVLIFFAIKITPFMKWAFALIGLMPMTVAQIASLSADGITIGVSLLFIAFIFSYAFDKSKTRIGWKDFAILCVLGASVALSKQAYLTLLGLFLLIPYTKINKNIVIAYATVAIVCIFSVLPAIGWSNAFTAKGYTEADKIRIESRIDVVEKDPDHIVKVVFNDIYNYNGGHYFESLIGRLGWTQVRLSFLFVIIPYACALFFIVLTEKNKPILITNWNKAVSGLIAIGTVVLIQVVLYLFWTKASLTTIEGVQGRYFIPLLPLFFILLWNKSFFFIPKFKYPRFYLALFVAIVLTQSVVQMLYFYFIPIRVIALPGS